jgi:hypothetical protein
LHNPDVGLTLSDSHRHIGLGGLEESQTGWGLVRIGGFTLALKRIWLYKNICFDALFAKKFPKRKS